MPKLVPLLSKKFTVINYDRRGRSNSTDSTTYSPEREVEDIAALISSSGVSAYLFGMSSGATLSLMAAANSLPIAKLALFEPPFEVGEKKNVYDSTNHHDNLKELIAADNRSAAVKYFMKKIVGMPSFVVTIMSLLPMWRKMKANANSLPYDLEITTHYTLKRLKSHSISTPTLVIYGGKSPETLQSAARAVSDLMDNSKTEVLERQNHNVSMKVLAPILIDFFTE